MVEIIQNEDHIDRALGEVLRRCRHRLFLATADIKNLHVPPEVIPVKRRSQSSSIVDVLRVLGESGVQIRLLHSSVPSGPFLDELKKGVPENLVMKRCLRMHAKAFIADGRYMYLGSANITGAGAGARGTARRNFEAGVCTDDVSLIDPVIDMLEEVFQGRKCSACGIRECFKPLEEPEL